MDSSSTPNKPSGIPRLSRLPVLRSQSSQTFQRKPEIPENYKPAAETPKLQKRASVAYFPRGSLYGDFSTTVNTPIARAQGTNGMKSTSRPTVTRTGSIRPSSRGNQQRIPPRSSKPAQAEDEENHDQLGSLDGFRAASRQGFLDDDASPIEYHQSTSPDEELFRPRDRTKSRPSLSDRTIESLQQLPSTPKGRRSSSFFSPVESPMGPPPRPASALSRNGSSHSRPETGDGTFVKPMRPVSPAKKAPASAKPASRIGGGFGFTPGSEKRRRVSTAFTTKLRLGGNVIPPSPRAPSPSKASAASVLPSGRNVKTLAGSKTLAARPTKPRPALGDAFAPKTETSASGTLKNVTSTPMKASQPKRVTSNPSNSSSAALREQIAAAKAAARDQKAKHDSPQQSTADFESSDASSHVDPFNLAPKDSKHILRNRIKAAWTDGKLNIAGMGLTRMPDEVLQMYDAAAMQEGKVNWAEVLDMTKLIAADNELEDLETVFPDRSGEELAEDDNAHGNQFGGLEVLDLHGNHLQALPMGLRRLERLTSLNLAHNKLDNTCLDIVAQVSSLKELRLGHNNLSGNLPGSFCSLHHLETLDLQANRLLGLPEALRELVSLKVLNVAGNQLTAVPMESLQQLPLIELDAGSNALIGSLFPVGGEGRHATLQTLVVSNNSLAALTFSEELHLSSLRTLDVTNNHLTILPSISALVELTTLTAGDNKIVELPEGFTTLQKLRNVNFTSNELRTLDPEVARMERLESLILAANPLREKKYLTMTAADIKRDLRAKLEPDGEASEIETNVDTGPVNDIAPETAPMWSLKANGLLDLSSRGLSDDINDSLGSFLKGNEVRELRLQGNNLTAIPPALWLGQDLRVLDVSNNPFDSDYLFGEIDLPELRELYLSHCRLTTLEPLTSQLSAPALQSLHVRANRLCGSMPMLRDMYPALRTLIASDNKWSTVTADALRGLQTVDLASNDLQSLPAELGLLWDEGGLRSLEVGSNPFRVPSYRVLEKGTEATLRWLRNKLPAEQSAL